jgi:hypothetical protein
MEALIDAPTRAEHNDPRLIDPQGEADRQDERGAEPVKQSMSVARTDTSGALTGLEKIAYGVACFMMLAPLAVAAWGAQFAG